MQKCKIDAFAYRLHTVDVIAHILKGVLNNG